MACVLRRCLYNLRSQQPEIQEWQQTSHRQLLGIICLPQLILRLAAVSTEPQIQEWQQKHGHLLGCAGRSSAVLGHNSHRFKNGHKAASVAWMCTPQLLLHLAAVSAETCTTPGHNSLRFKNGSKSTIGSCLDVLDVPQLLLHLAAVSAPCYSTPGHNSPRFQNGSKSTVTCLDVLDIPELLLHLAAVSTAF